MVQFFIRKAAKNIFDSTNACVGRSNSVQSSTHAETELSLTSTNPPAICRTCVSFPAVYFISPAASDEISGACPGRTWKLPSSPGNVTEVTFPSNTVRSGETTARCNSFVSIRLSLRCFQQFLTLFDGVFNRTYVQEGLLGQIVDFTVQNHLETFDCIFNGNHHTRNAGKLFGHSERL